MVLIEARSGGPTWLLDVGPALSQMTSSGQWKVPQKGSAVSHQPSTVLAAGVMSAPFLEGNLHGADVKRAFQFFVSYKTSEPCSIGQMFKYINTLFFSNSLQRSY